MAYGKIIIVSLDSSEDSLFQKLYNLVNDEQIQQMRLESKQILEFSGLRIDMKAKTVSYKDEMILFNYLEFSTLSFLAAYPEWVFTKEQIYEAVWKEPGEFCGSAVTNVISQIRRKLRKAGVKKEYIQTVINQGYKFVP